MIQHFSTVLRRRSVLLPAGLTLGVGLIAALGAFTHPASVGPALAFHVAFLVLAALIAPRPRSHAYTALAVMLLLGFWTKFLIRLVHDYPYLEPVGRFDGSTEAWDRALLTIAVATCGAVVARVGHLLLARRASDWRRPSSIAGNPPDLYVRHHRTWWVLLAVVTVAAYTWNAYAAVHVTGVNPTVVLPFSGNAALAWWYLLGLPMSLAVLLGWEMRRRGERTLPRTLLWIPVVEAIVNSASLMSRASYLLRVAPYLLAGSLSGPAPQPRLLRTGSWRTTAILSAGLVVSLVSVMTLRAIIYHAPPVDVDAEATPVAVSSKPAAARGTQRLQSAVRETSRLFLDRWTGMEGVLAIAATDTSPELFMAIVGDDPANGTASLYQELADARYEAQSRFTFLTLAGVVAVLATAGSSVVVFAGMALIVGVFIATEEVARQGTGNDLLSAVMSVEMAFMIAQVTFPRLLGAFVLETWMAIAVLSWVHHGLTARVRVGRHALVREP